MELLHIPNSAPPRRCSTPLRTSSSMELLHIPNSAPPHRCSTPLRTSSSSSAPPSPGKSRWARLKRAEPTRQHRQEGRLQGLPLRPARCSSSSYSTPASDVVELPLFPLPLVLFPGAILPLQIFEFRYRIMMHTLLETDLRFGVVFSDAGSVAGVGCVGEVVKHERLVDDRFFLICKGQERFRITRLIRTKPYLVAEVAWLEDRPPPPGAPEVEEGEEEDLEMLATEVERYMKDVIRISNRLNGKDADKEGAGAEAADLRRGQFPTPFSFFVGSTFEGAPREQQALLELQDTGARLRRERETLSNTLNYLTAASAVKDAFPSSPSSPS